MKKKKKGYINFLRKIPPFCKKWSSAPHNSFLQFPQKILRFTKK